MHPNQSQGYTMDIRRYLCTKAPLILVGYDVIKVTLPSPKHAVHTLDGLHKEPYAKSTRRRQLFPWSTHHPNLRKAIFCTGNPGFHTQRRFLRHLETFNIRTFNYRPDPSVHLLVRDHVTIEVLFTFYQAFTLTHQTKHSSWIII